MKNATAFPCLFPWVLALLPFASPAQTDSLSAERFARLASATADPDSQIFYRQEALAAWQRVFPQPHPKVVDAMNALASTYAGSRGDAETSLTLRRQALEWATALGDSARMVRLLFNLGRLHLVRQEFELAEVFYRQSLACLPASGSLRKEETLILEGLIFLHGSAGELEKALAYAAAADSLHLAFPDVLTRNIYWNSLGNAYLKNGKPLDALSCFHREWQCLLPFKNDPRFPGLAADCLEPMAVCLFQAGKMDSCMLLLDSLVAFGKRRFRREFHAGLAPLFRQKALALAELGDFYAAQENLRLSLQAVNFHGDFATITHYQEAFKAFAEKGKLYFRQYETSGDDRFLRLCLEAFDLADAAVRLARKLLPDPTARERLSDLYAADVETAIVACLEMQRLTGKQKFAVEAFRFSEQCKSLQLSEAFRQLEARSLPDAPDLPLLQIEDSLRHEIATLKWQRENLTAPPGNVAGYDRKIFERMQALEKLQAQFKLENPHFSELRFGGESLDVNELRANCKRDTSAIVEYFWGKERLFAFVLNDSAVSGLELSVPENLQDTIAHFRQTILAYSPDSTDALAMAFTWAYVQTAERLHRLLIKPLKPMLRSRLVFVPDQSLCRLPFAALLDELPKEQLDYFHTFPYLGTYHAISYGFSAVLQAQMQARQHPGADTLDAFLGIAPDFNQPELHFRWVREMAANEVSRLRHTVPEVLQIRELLGVGRVLIGGMSNLETLLAWIEKSRILHFATHALLDDRRGENSCLVLQSSERPEDLQRFYLWEILHLRLRADLVTLSACHTFEGDLRRTEGLRSLGSAFAYAGAKSIFAHLWEADDAASKDLSLLFYARLEAGTSKDRALQFAVSDYLDSLRSEQCHPKFWACLVGYGDMGGLTFLKKK